MGVRFDPFLGLVLTETEPPLVGTSVFEDNPPAGARPGTVFAVGHAYGIAIVRHGGFWQSRVSGAPGVNEFKLVGTVLTMGNTVNPGDDFYALGFI